MAEPIIPGLKGIQTELKGIQNQLAGLEAGSEEFVRLSVKAGQLRDKLKDIKEAVNANAGPAMESFGNNLFIARSQLTSLDLGGFGESLKRMGANVKGVTFKEMSTGLKSVSSGLGQLGKALLTNPIFLLATAIIAIVMNFESLTKAGGLVGKVFSFIGDTLNAVKNGMIAFSDAIGLTDSKAEARAEAAKKRMEETKKFVEDLDKFMDDARERNRTKNLSAEEKEIYDLQKKYSEMTNKAVEHGQNTAELEKMYREELASINKKYDKQEQEKANEKAKAKADQIKADQKQLTDFLKEENEKRLQATMSDMDKELRQVQVNYDAKMKLAHGNAVQEKALTDSLTLEQNAIRQKYADAEIKRQQEVAKSNADLLNQMKMDAITEEEELSQEIENLKMGARAADIQAVQDDYFLKIETARQNGMDTIALEAEMRRQVADINKQYDESDLAAATAKREKELELVRSRYTGQITMAQQAISVLSSLNEATAKGDEAAQRKAFDRNKKLQKAMAVVNMASGILTAFTAPDNVTMTQKLASAAVIAATGIANIVKISHTQYEAPKEDKEAVKKSSGSSGAGGTSSSGSSLSSLNLSFLNNKSTQPQPLQTYVVAGHVSSAQQADFKIKNQANIYNNG